MFTGGTVKLNNELTSLHKSLWKNKEGWPIFFHNNGLHGKVFFSNFSCFLIKLSFTLQTFCPDF